METPHQREYLSFGDALFLHLEQQGIPINIASVAVFEGSIRMEELLPYVEAKLSHVPRCMQRVIAPPFNIGLPSLEYDPNFDFRNHVHETTLQHGTDTELKALAGKLFSLNLDRNHPLWDFTLIHGLKGNRTALIARLHHSMADGMSGVAFLNALMDTSPEIPHLPRKKISIPVTAPHDPATTLLQTLTSSWFLTIERLLSAQGDLLTMARRLVSNRNSTNGASGSTESLPHEPHDTVPFMDDLSRILPEIASSPIRLPFNVICKGPQIFDWTEVPFEDLRALKNAVHCSFNDVALTVIASTYRRYAEFRGSDTSNRPIHIVVPVNTRAADDDSQGMGNQITFVPIAIPLGIRDPRKLLAAVHERMTMIKQARIAEMVSLAGALISAIPSPVQVFLGPIAAQLPLTLCNLIFTNVPGPRHPLYVLGHRMLNAYPYVPIGGEMGANCAVLTYDGTAHFGFSCDVHATPDSHLLPKFLQESLEELQQAFGLKVEKKKEKKARKAVKPQLKKKRPPKPQQEKQATPLEPVVIPEAKLPEPPTVEAEKPAPELVLAATAD
jgi:diacylglycerol O-acyltransferase